VYIWLLAGSTFSNSWITFSRTWTTGVSYVVTIVWRPDSNAFTFSVSGGAGPAESRTIAYTVADTAPPRGFAYDLRADAGAVMCSDPPPRVSIDARFDNVQLDIAAATAAQ